MNSSGQEVPDPTAGELSKTLPDAPSVPQNQKASPTIPLLVCGAPWLVVALSYTFSGNMTAAFFSNPINLAILGFMLLWNMIGYFIMLKSPNTSLRAFAIVVFVIPTLIVPIIGPAVATIFQALKP